MKASMLVPWIAAAAAWFAVLVQILMGTKFFKAFRTNRKRKKLRSMAEEQARRLIETKDLEPIEVLLERARNVYSSEVPFYVFEEDVLEDLEIAVLVFYLLFGPHVKHSPHGDKTFRIYHLHNGHLEEDEKSIFKIAADLLSTRGHWRSFNYFLLSQPDENQIIGSLLEIAYAPDKTIAINRTAEKQADRILRLLLDEKRIQEQSTNSTTNS